MILIILVLFTFQELILHNAVDADKKPKPYNHTIPNVKYDNPNYVRDRWRRPDVWKPQMPVAWSHRDVQPYTPAWMDYCDPHHCRDYHKVACGLNRSSMRFKWFQSTCHLILNNMCYYHRGLRKYDLVDTKYCQSFVMQVRSGGECRAQCSAGAGERVLPVCAVTADSHVVLFKNRCALDVANCGFWSEPYDEVSMSVCQYYWNTMTSQ